MSDYIAPTSWTDQGMDWEHPDSTRAVYVDALRLATIERCLAVAGDNYATSNPPYASAVALSALPVIPGQLLSYATLKRIYDAIVGLMLNTYPYGDQWTAYVPISDPVDPVGDKWNFYTPASAVAAIGDSALLPPQKSVLENNAWLRQAYKLLNLMRYGGGHQLVGNGGVKAYGTMYTREVAENINNPSDGYDRTTSSLFSSSVTEYKVSVSYLSGGVVTSRSSTSRYFVGQLRYITTVPCKAAGILCYYTTNFPIPDGAWFPAGVDASKISKGKPAYFQPLASSDVVGPGQVVMDYLFGDASLLTPHDDVKVYYSSSSVESWVGGILHDFQFSFRNW